MLAYIQYTHIHLYTLWHTSRIATISLTNKLKLKTGGRGWGVGLRGKISTFFSGKKLQISQNFPGENLWPENLWNKIHKSPPPQKKIPKDAVTTSVLLRTGAFIPLHTLASAPSGFKTVFPSAGAERFIWALGLGAPWALGVEGQAAVWERGEPHSSEVMSGTSSDCVSELSRSLRMLSGWARLMSQTLLATQSFCSQFWCLQEGSSSLLPLPPPPLPSSSFSAIWAWTWSESSVLLPLTSW